MHPKIDGPQPKTYTPANSNSCAYCGVVLAYTLDRKNFGLLGIQAIYAEQEACDNKSTALKLVTVRPVKGKKQSALFKK